MRRAPFTGFALVLAAGAMIVIGGAALPASAASAHARPAASAQARPADSSTFTGSEGDGSCTFGWETKGYVSQYNYETIQAWLTSSTCGANAVSIEAGVTCWNSSDTLSTNMWGAADSTVGSSYFSQAACNKSWPNFFGGGGYRSYYDGSWHYHTELY